MQQRRRESTKGGPLSFDAVARQLNKRAKPATIERTSVRAVLSRTGAADVHATHRPDVRRKSGATAARASNVCELFALLHQSGGMCFRECSRRVRDGRPLFRVTDDRPKAL